MPNRLNVDLLMRTLSEILSDQYGAKVTITARPKQLQNEEAGKEETPWEHAS